MEMAIKNITKTFAGVTALHDVSILFESGKITSIIGPNGSGKTTLTHLLTGIHSFDGGAVALGGRTFFRIDREQVYMEGIGRTFQEVRLFGQLSVAENIMLALAHRGVTRAACERSTKSMRAKTRSLLADVELEEKSDAFADTLSYGQRKLLEIARVRALAPSIIFFDEPFAGLFPEMIERVVSIMQHMRDEGVTQILIEHNLELIRRLSDRLIVLDAGSVLAHGAPDDVLARTDVMTAYLGK
ncbi:ATP-binding cassette domain-containing protein [Candidatus Uhrbacteria bacterium]|nr:ATP-binding cassette domain-containing protein [Candidatus Uhrbacteria bacterium]